MKKKILIGCIIAVLFILSLPSMTGLSTSAVEKETKSEDIVKNDVNLEARLDIFHSVDITMKIDAWSYYIDWGSWTKISFLNNGKIDIDKRLSPDEPEVYSRVRIKYPSYKIINLRLETLGSAHFPLLIGYIEY